MADKVQIAHLEGPHEEEIKEEAVHISSQLKSHYDKDLSIWQTVWLFKRVVFYSCCLYVGYVCEGFELGAGGSVIANAGFVAQFGEANGGGGVRDLNPTWVSTWSAFLNVGQLLTFTYVGWLADRFGRKWALYVAWLWLIIGCVLLNVAKSPPVWAIAKLCNGAGIGIMQVVVQVYVMEISPNKIRGGLVTFYAVWNNVGGIIVSAMMQHLNKNRPYDYLFAMRILFAPIGAMIFIWLPLPESPWYLARKGEKEKALKSMRRLYGGIPNYNFEEEYVIIVNTIAHEADALAKTPSYKDVFRGVNLRRTLTIMLISVTNQFAGLAIISTYSTYFFSLAGLNDPFLGSLILACVNLLAVIAWVLTADKLGRRWVVNGCQTLVLAVLFTVGGLQWSGATTGNVAAGTALLFICCIWTFCFTIIALSYYLYSAELPSALLRVKTGPITFVINSLVGIATCYATPPMLLKLELKTAFVYGAFSAPMCLLMWMFVPETKGRSAAEIDELYENNIPAWRWSKHKTNVEQFHTAGQAN